MKKFNNTIEKTLQTKDFASCTYYLDKHVKNGVPFYTISIDETLLHSFASISEAEHAFSRY